MAITMLIIRIKVSLNQATDFLYCGTEDWNIRSPVQQMLSSTRPSTITWLSQRIPFLNGIEQLISNFNRNLLTQEVYSHRLPSKTVVEWTKYKLKKYKTGRCSYVTQRNWHLMPRSIYTLYNWWILCVTKYDDHHSLQSGPLCSCPSNSQCTKPISSIPFFHLFNRNTVDQFYTMLIFDHIWPMSMQLSCSHLLNMTRVQRILTFFFIITSPTNRESKDWGFGNLQTQYHFHHVSRTLSCPPWWQVVTTSILRTIRREIIISFIKIAKFGVNIAQINNLYSTSWKELAELCIHSQHKPVMTLWGKTISSIQRGNIEFSWRVRMRDIEHSV